MARSTLALRLLELRQSHNLTQQQIGEALNIGRTTYAYYESGTRIPDLSTLLLITKYYRVDISSLVNDSTMTLSNNKSINDLQDAIYMRVIQHLKQKRIPLEMTLSLTKEDFDFLINYKKLTPSNQDELKYLMRYKLKKQKAK